jgi:hypothetical protein
MANRRNDAAAFVAIALTAICFASAVAVFIAYRVGAQKWAMPIAEVASAVALFSLAAYWRRGRSG